MMSGPLSRRLTGWLLDAYPVHDGMAIWILDDEGIRCRLVDPYRPSFYLAGSSTDLAVAGRLLTGQRISYRVNHVQCRELWSANAIPVCEVWILQSTRFYEAVKRLMTDAPQLRFYHADVGLPQRYFYDRGLFPLCRCEVEITADAVVRAIAASESPWETDYRLPPLQIMEFLLDGASPNPNHGGVVQLAVRVEGEERVLNGDDPAEFLQTVDALLQRHDPDILLTDWGDSYILPRLLRMSAQMRVPLRLNRDPAHAVGTRALWPEATALLSTISTPM